MSGKPPHPLNYHSGGEPPTPLWLTVVLVAVSIVSSLILGSVILSGIVWGLIL